MRRGGISLQNNPGYPVLGNYTTWHAGDYMHTRRREEAAGGGRRRKEAGGDGRRREEAGGGGRRREEVGGRVRRAATGEVCVCAMCNILCSVVGGIRVVAQDQ